MIHICSPRPGNALPHQVLIDYLRTLPAPVAVHVALQPDAARLEKAVPLVAEDVAAASLPDATDDSELDDLDADEPHGAKRGSRAPKRSTSPEIEKMAKFLLPSVQQSLRCFLGRIRVVIVRSFYALLNLGDDIVKRRKRAQLFLRDVKESELLQKNVFPFLELEDTSKIELHPMMRLQLLMQGQDPDAYLQAQLDAEAGGAKRAKTPTVFDCVATRSVAKLVEEGGEKGGRSGGEVLPVDDDAGWRADGEQTDGMLGFMVNTVRDLFEQRASGAVDAKVGGSASGSTTSPGAEKESAVESADVDSAAAAVSVSPAQVWQAIISHGDVLGLGVTPKNPALPDEDVHKRSHARTGPEFPHNSRIPEHSVVVYGEKSSSSPDAEQQQVPGGSSVSEAPESSEAELVALKSFAVPGNTFRLPVPSWMVNGKLFADFSYAQAISKRVRASVDSLVEDFVREEGERRESELERRGGRAVEDMDAEEFAAWEKAGRRFGVWFGLWK